MSRARFSSVKVWPVLMVVIFVFQFAPGYSAFAAESDKPSTVSALKKKLLEDRSKSSDGRTLSQAKPEELEYLNSGGDFGEYVVKFGTSVFILDMYKILATFAFPLIVLLLFTPLGAIFGWVLQKKLLFEMLGGDNNGNKWANTKVNSKSFSEFMNHVFIKKYENNVQAIAFIGTAFLIAMIGLRGVKIGITTHQPDYIIMAIIIEVSVLLLLAITTWYKDESDKDKEIALGTGKQLTYREVADRLDALKKEFEENVAKEQAMRP